MGALGFVGFWFGAKMPVFRFVCSMLCLAGCAPDTEPISFDVDDPDDEDVGEELTDDDGPQTYALKEVLSIEVKNPNPLSGKWGYQTTSSWKRLEWNRTDLEIEWSEELCGIYVSEVFGTKTAFPSAFIDTMPIRNKSGALSDALVGGLFEAGPFADLNGVELDEPFTDALPASATDPGVIDQDGDGKPGITVNIDNDLMGKGDVYAIQRNLTSYSGTVVANGRIEGYVETAVEQVTVGASDWWLETEAETRDDADPTHSYFILVEVEDLDCGAIIDQRLTIF
jgi:hypothetical protein